MTLANRVAAFVTAMITSFVLMVRMVQNTEPLKSIKSALLCGLVLGGLSWTVTLIGESVLASADQNTANNRQLSGERKSD